MDTYGDLVTNLLCFFVLLYSFSNIDAEKWKALVGSFTGGNSIVIEAMDEQTVRQKEIVVEGISVAYEDETEPEEPEEVLADGIYERYELQFDELYEKIRNYIITNGLESSISATRYDDVISVRFLEVALFESGKADILPDGLKILGHVIEFIAENIDAVDMVRIEGHTDNVPIHTYEFDSNWELSMARANAALRVFLSSGRIDLDKLSAAAYGEYHPVETNDTEEGRAANRRVDFVIEKVILDS
jgi:chemotaxis protein MotB